MKRNRLLISLFTGVLTLVLLVTSCSNMLESLETVTINYKTEYVNDVESKTVKVGAKLTVEELPILSHENHNFLGWFYNGNLITEGYEIQNNLTLTAKWEEKIVLKLDKVEFSTTSKEVEKGDIITLSCNNKDATIYYTRDNTEPTNKSKVYDKGILIDVDDEVTIKAIATKNGYLNSDISSITYNIKKYSITYILNGGSGLTSNKKEGFIKGHILTSEDLPTPNKDDCDFEGWTDISGNKVNIGDELVSNIIISAQWKAVEPTPTPTPTPNPNPKPTDPNKPHIIEGHDGTAGTSWTYVEFGVWPQTKYTGVDSSLTKCENINSWENCYKDKDGNYYVKVRATPLYMEDTHNDSNILETMYKFSDGTTVESGVYYYFKLEPIKWRVLTNNFNGKKLLLAENILGPCRFNEYSKNETKPNISGTVSTQNYEFSELRAFFNGLEYIGVDGKLSTKYVGKGFLQKAFNQKEIDIIAVTEVNNSIVSGIDTDNTLKPSKITCNNTNDKIFALSAKEATNVEYGFNSGTPSVSNRVRNATDYCIATGIIIFDKDKTKKNLRWALRSPSDISIRVRSVGENGEISSTFIHTYDQGFVPALAIEF